MLPNEIFERIIEEQSQIMGSKLSRERALKAGGIRFKNAEFDIELTKEPKETLEKLIYSYGEVFGNSSIDVCIDMLQSFPYEEISQYLPENIRQKVQVNATVAKLRLK